MNRESYREERYIEKRKKNRESIQREECYVEKRKKNIEKFREESE
jgi:hypothetical protein